MRTHDRKWTLTVVDCRLPVVGRVVVSSDRAQRTLVGFNDSCGKWEEGKSSSPSSSPPHRRAGQVDRIKTRTRTRIKLFTSAAAAAAATDTTTARLVHEDPLYYKCPPKRLCSLLYDTHSILPYGFYLLFFPLFSVFLRFGFFCSPSVSLSRRCRCRLRILSASHVPPTRRKNCPRPCTRGDFFSAHSPLANRHFLLPSSSENELFINERDEKRTR